MTKAELLNNIFLETDTIKMNNLIVNYLTGNYYDLRAIDDAVNLLDSPLTNSINSKELTFETTASAIYTHTLITSDKKLLMYYKSYIKILTIGQIL